MYLLQYNIYIYIYICIVILATCFDSYESSSGINIQELLVHIVLQFFLCLSRTIAIGIPLCIIKPGLSLADPVYIYNVTLWCICGITVVMEPQR